MKSTSFLPRSAMNYPGLLFGVIFLSSAFVPLEIKGEDNVAAALSNQTEKSEVVLSEDEIVLEKWRKTEKFFKDTVSQVLKLALPSVLRLSEDITISPRCAGSVMKMAYGIKQMKVWAWKMIDASGKIPGGLFNGYMSSLGDFDGCLAVDVPGSKGFRGQYCSIFITSPLPERKPYQNSEIALPLFVNFAKNGTLMEEMTRRANYFYQVPLRTAVCIPSTCSREDVQTVAYRLIDLVGIGFNMTVPTCDVTEPVVFNKQEIIIMCVLSSIFLLVFIATARDAVLNTIWKEKGLETESSTAVKCLMCFSAYTNTLRLLKKDSSPDSIKFFHGMKVVSMLWILFNHTYFFANHSLSGYLAKKQSFGKEIAFQFSANGYLVVETFFFISAALLAYGNSGKQINIPLYVFRRVWRLMPPFMLVIATSMLVPHIGSGPGWKETVGSLIDTCKSYWWANLLFVNNFLHPDNMCLQWLWYIPVDTHMYILALFVLVFLKSRPRVALIMNAVLFIAGTVATAASHIYHGNHPTHIYVFSHQQDMNAFFAQNFFRTYTHITTCCIGFYVGCFLAKRPKLKIPTMLNILGWLCSMILGLVVVYGTYEWQQGNLPGMAVSALYACTNKVVWALALSYITIACFTGNGGVITSILSWSALTPLSRLTYMTYIIHPIFQFMYIGSARLPITADHRTYVYTYLATIVISYGFAYITAVLFEIPFMGLDRIMFSKKKAAPNCSRKSKPEQNGKFGKMPKCEESAIATINIKKIENERL